MRESMIGSAQDGRIQWHLSQDTACPHSVSDNANSWSRPFLRTGNPRCAQGGANRVNSKQSDGFESQQIALFHARDNHVACNHTNPTRSAFAGGIQVLGGVIAPPLARIVPLK
jgi:hypothetical protein